MDNSSFSPSQRCSSCRGASGPAAASRLDNIVGMQRFAYAGRRSCARLGGPISSRKEGKGERQKRKKPRKRKRKAARTCWRSQKTARRRSEKKARGVKNEGQAATAATQSCFPNPRCSSFASSSSIPSSSALCCLCHTIHDKRVGHRP